MQRIIVFLLKEVINERDMFQKEVERAYMNHTVRFTRTWALKKWRKANWWALLIRLVAESLISEFLGEMHKLNDSSSNINGQTDVRQ